MSQSTAPSTASAPAVEGEASVLIHVPPDRVFAYLLDFTRHPEWSTNLGKVRKLTEGPIGVGSRFEATEWAPPVSLPRRVLSSLFYMVGVLTGAGTSSQAEILALDEGRSITWVGRILRRSGEFNRSEWRITLTPEAGGTRVAQRFRYQPQTGAARGMVAALDGAAGIQRATAFNLDRLRAVLERNP